MPGLSGHFNHGLGAVDELNQHTHIHVAALGFFQIVIGNGVDIERIVLALASGNDGVTHGGNEFDQFHTRRRLVASAERIGNAQTVSLSLEVSADGDIGFDIHHDEMLAMFHGAQADFSADSRNAGGVDHNIDQIIFEDQIGIVRNGNLAAFHGRGQFRGVRNFLAVTFFLIGDIDCFQSVWNAQFGNGANFDARHMRHARYDIGAHFAGANQPDTDRPPAVRTRLHITCQARQRHIRRHLFLLMFLQAPSRLSSNSR
jgi:hypothetical protein